MVGTSAEDARRFPDGTEVVGPNGEHGRVVGRKRLAGITAVLVDTGDGSEPRPLIPGVLSYADPAAVVLTDDDADAETEARLAFNRDVSEAARKLRVAQAARERLAQEAARAEDYAALYLNADELDQLPTPEPLIDRVITRHSYAILNGRDGVWKSFVGLDWGFCLATGKAWQGREVQRARVLYIAGEGAFGIQRRKAAWEHAWGVTVPADMFAVRVAAVNLYTGGPPLEELLQRVEEGRYGLVVIDTLRRASGRADGNSTDMGVVVDNIERIKRATDKGSVLVIAHTGKDDSDSRGFSGIEDDADIVWHAKRSDDRHPMALDLECKKMKDGPDGERLELAMDTALDSLVVSNFARPHWGGQVDNHATDDQILEAMRESFADTGASVSQLIEVTAMARATVYKARGRLLKSGQLASRRKAGTDYLFLPAQVWTAGGPVYGESTPEPEASSTPVQGPPEHESTPIHTSPRLESTPVHTSLAPLKGGEGVDTVDESLREVLT